MAKIIIRRKASIAGCAVKHNVYISDNFLGELKSGGFIEIPVDIGTHTLTFEQSTLKILGKKDIKFDVVINEHDEVVELKTYFKGNAEYIVKYADNKPHSPLLNDEMKISVADDGDKTSSTKLTYKEKTLQNKEKMYRKMKYKFTFVSGLPLMQGTLCKVVSTFDKIIIDGQGTTFELSKKKITSITIEENITNHSQATSSAGGAMAGAMAFGMIGAAIGGRVTTKNVKIKKYYLVITYFDKEENIKYIAFDYNYKAPTLVEDFKIFNKENVDKKIIEID